MLINHGFRFKYFFFLRQAKLLRRETRLFPLTDTNEPQDAFVSFIAQFYGQKKSCFTNKEVLVPAGIHNEALAEVLGVTVRTPKRSKTCLTRDGT